MLESACNRHFLRSLLTFALLGSMSVALFAETAQRRVPRRGSAAIDGGTAEAADERKRLREGGELTAVTGTFKSTGDRITFYPNDRGDSLRALENQTLERIWSVLQETSEREWTVSGMVTEYRGANYLLVTRAVVQTKDKPKATGSAR
jgi:hypothetical protein